ncbi:hypothetical protein N7492_006084 [Penicillium capsulatum]|uniref:Cell pattern formation-associated protein stuA n=1 Tax=Penicillium capsulatum TaxID=69766 RepID=A0A9W9LMM8_9EURO|nr:hypothetical protein N7492_006084 [Penicillium capsulatum]
MSRSLPKKNNPLIIADAAPAYDELLQRRRLGKTNLSVKPGQIGTSNATKPENLGLFEYAHLRAPLPKDLKGSEIFPSHPSQSHPETYFLMRRSKDGFVSATGMFKIAFPWAKADEERAEREYLKSREYTSQEEVAGNVWISPMFALELSREYKMYDWVRALLDPTDIVQSPSSAKKQITPPPKFEMPEESSISQRRSRRSVSPSKKSTSPRKSRAARSTKDAPATPSTNAANDSLQKALEVTASTVETDLSNGVVETVEETEVKTNGSPEKKSKGRKSKKALAEAEAETAGAKPEDDTEEKVKNESKEEKKSEKKKKKDTKEKEAQVEVTASTDTAKDAKTTQTTVSLDVPLLQEVPSAAETEDMIAKAKEMVEDAIKSQQAEGAPTPSSAAKVTKKRKPVDDEDEETSAESAQRAKKAKVLEDKLKRERVRNRALFGVSAAFALAASIPYFF